MRLIRYEYITILIGIFALIFFSISLLLLIKNGHLQELMVHW